VAKKTKSVKLFDPAVPGDAEVTSGGEAWAETTSSTALADELVASREEVAKNLDLYLRARADLENYRKRAQRDKEDLVRFANENLLRELLPVLDNLERAIAHAQNGESGLLQGVEMTLGQLRKVLERAGVTAVTAEGQPFDPACHEAMGQLESPDHSPNTVIQELQKGFLLNERLLRPTLVMVSKTPAGPPAAKGDDDSANDNQ
jgi:molecular chaperone GrpE